MVNRIAIRTAFIWRDFTKPASPFQNQSSIRISSVVRPSSFGCLQFFLPQSWTQNSMSGLLATSDQWLCPNTSAVPSTPTAQERRLSFRAALSFYFPLCSYTLFSTRQVFEHFGKTARRKTKCKIK